jgi:hemerythrin-like domain-containing protein
LLRDHIQKENSILFEIADMKLGRDAQGDLFDAFEKLETEQIGVGKHEEFHKLLDKLAGIYLN